MRPDRDGTRPDALRRAEIVELARAWIGTPYHHQASLRGVGTDCVGLLRGLWREIHGTEAERPPAYSRDWAEATGRETLLAAAERHLVRVPVGERAAGDVLVFRIKAHVPAKHVGLVATDETFIHAMEGVCVSEVRLNGWWQRRIAAVFRFPGVVD